MGESEKSERKKEQRERARVKDARLACKAGSEK